MLNCKQQLGALSRNSQHGEMLRVLSEISRECYHGEIKLQWRNAVTIVKCCHSSGNRMFCNCEILLSL